MFFIFAVTFDGNISFLAHTNSINAPFMHQPDDFFNNNRKIYVHIDLVFTIFGDARAVNITVVVVINEADTICFCRSLSTLRCEYN